MAKRAISRGRRPAKRNQTRAGTVEPKRADVSDGSGPIIPVANLPEHGVPRRAPEVLVLGDYRVHFVMGVPDPPSPTEYVSAKVLRGAEQYWQMRYGEELRGGVALTETVIKQALKLCARQPSPQVAGLSLDNEQATQVALWDVASFPTIDRRLDRLRLTSPFYQPTKNTQPSFGLPDPAALNLLVLDDLGLSFRTEPQSGESAASKIRAVLEALSKRRNSSSGSENADPFLIIASVANNLPDINTGIWRTLYRDEALRESTVVLLNAEDLRAENFRISTTVSWERTAQDLVTELRENHRIVPFTRFRHLIVRFGITGALFVHRSKRESEPRFTLFFDPNRDDTSFTDSASCGVVLGYPAIFLGCLSKAYIDSTHPECRRDDFDSNVGATIVEAIGRCQLLYNWGYGTKQKDVYDTLLAGHGLPSVVFDQEWPFRRRSRSLYPESFISQSTVPLNETSVWDILTQCAAGQRRRIAQDIVVYGVEQVLNQTELDLDHLRRSLVTVLTEMLRDTMPTLEMLMSVGMDVESICSSYAANIRAHVGKKPPTAEDALTGDCDVSDLKAYLLDLWDLTIKGWLSKKEVFGNRPANLKRDVALFVLKGLCGPDAESSDPNACQLLLRSPPAWIGELIISYIDRLVLASENRKQLKAEFDQLKVCLLAREPFFTMNLEDAIPATRPVVAPIAWFDQAKEAVGPTRRFPVIDRREIEGYRIVDNLIRRHLDQLREKRNERPLSIGVFGPPGSGKTSAILNILDGIESENKIRKLRFNLSQFVTTKDLDGAFEKIVDSLALHEIPIAFFDEFDARLESEELGWLKYFLAPMEDGRFKDRPVGDAILVFAGGTSETFLNFSRASRATTDNELVDFRHAKGPDFVSRLRGHLDILGINPTGNHDNLYLIRRAVMLRSRLESMQKLKPADTPVIDQDLLRALLHVPIYKHGGRSLRMALELVSNSQGHILKSYIPSLGQLNMHVDGKAFLDLLNDGD
jgi:hypothetical protein